MEILKRARGALSAVLVLLWLGGPGVLILYPFLLPLGLLWRSRRRAIASCYFRLMSRGILGLLRLGGARFERRGSVPTREPCLILMNHQSLLDICTVGLMTAPYVPAFVPRRRYTRWYVLAVAATIRLLECPVVDPKRDSHGAVLAMREAALRSRHGLLVFPEGHRTLDGELRPFKTAGTRAILETRRLPVYLVVTDGFWAGRRLVDFVFNVHRLRGRTEVLGPFQPPEAPEQIEGFIAAMRDTIASRLRELRGKGEAAA
jgi:1-acyl-sn-glycerol-3-phosphate acyltransferase